jgi:hypothetical protein
MRNTITHWLDLPPNKLTAELRRALAEKLRLFRLEKKRTERKK